MSALWHWLSHPADGIEGAEARRLARLLSTLLLGLAALMIGGAVWARVNGPNPTRVWLLGSAAVVLAIAYGLSRTRHYLRGAILGLVLLSALPFAMIVAGRSYDERAFMVFVWSVLTLLITSLFLSPTGIVAVGAFHILALGALVLLVPSVTFSMILLPAGLLLSASALMAIAAGHRGHLQREYRAQLRGIQGELDQARDLLERGAEERSEEWARRACYVEATAAVARDAASALDLKELLNRVVALVSERLGYYYCGVYLLDRRGDWAVLEAASSPGGQQLLARDHRLRVGEGSVVGGVAGRGEARLAGEAGALDHPELSQTRSEMALPLRSGGEILGVLDVQSREPEAFGKEDTVVLQTLADQVAVAIRNARLTRQVKESLEAEGRAYGDMTREAWQELLHHQKGLGFLSDSRGTSGVAQEWQPHVERAMRTGAPSNQGDDRALAVPVRLRDQVIGVIDAHLPPGGRQWSPEQVALLQTLADRLGEALEGAQLYRSAQQRVARERLTREITDKLRSALRAEVLLQTAIRETAHVLGASRAFVQWAGEAQGAEAQE